MLGFNFYKHSPRFMAPQAAREVILAVRAGSPVTDPVVSMIGVFVNESSDEVARVAEELELDGLQLHGDETNEYCRRLKQSAPQKMLIKVLSAASPREPETLRQFAVDAVMIDAHDPKLRGGTGRLADWTSARQLASQLPRVFLAGGLSPENVAGAIASVHPYGVDACSSLEVSPGKKSAKRMREFVDAVRTSTLQSEASTAGEGN